jgi:predicted Zn-dependent protease
VQAREQIMTGCRRAALAPIAILSLAATAALLCSVSLSHAAPPRSAKPRGQRAVQPAQNVPFAPDQFFENMFGQPTAEQAEALAKIEISTADERRFGDSLVEAYLADLRRQKLKVVERGRDVEYLRDLVETLQPFMTNHDRYRKIKLYVVDSPQTDARSFPGGTLFFLRGLLDFAGSEAALVGVVGHELSHLDRAHQLAPLKRMKYFERSMSGAESFSPERMMSAIGTMAAGYARPFRPEDESEADRDGAAWAFRAGYDPRELAELFMKLHRRDGDRAVVPLSFLRTHPFHLDRYEAIQKQSRELQRKSPVEKLYVGRRNLKERTSRAKRAYNE